MIKKEIKHFRLKVGSYENIGVSVPCSVLAALVGEGIIPEPYFGTNMRDIGGICELGAELTADFEVDTVMLGMDNLLLRINGLDAPAVVLVNGTPIAGISASHVPTVLDIKSKAVMGRNTLKIRLAPRKTAEGEYLSDISLFAPVELQAYNKCLIDNVLVRQSYDGEAMHLSLELSTVGYNTKPRAVAVLVSPGGRVRYCTLIEGKGTIDVINPELWRPGRANSHHLYRLTVNLYSDTELVDTAEYKIGLRTVCAAPAGGTRLSLCGECFYPTVATHTLTDLIKPLATEQRVELMLRRAVSAGIDMLYVASDVAYPSEYFLSLCDSLGLALVIRAIVSNTDRTGAGEVILRNEIARSLRRLGNHPSVFAITGCESCSDILCEEMSRLLPNAVYLEGGEMSASAPPSLMTPYTARRYLSDDDMNLCSTSMSARTQGSTELMLRMISEGYRMPHSYGEWTYLSGVISAEAAQESLRTGRASTDGVGATVSALSEPLPGVSASVLDYSGRVKAAYYYLSRSAIPVHIYAVRDGLKVRFYAANMQSFVYKSRLSYAVIRNDNRAIVRDSVAFEAAPYTTSVIYEYDATEAVRGHEREYYIHYYATDSSGMHSRGTLLFVAPAAFELLRPSITAEISGAGSDYALTLYSDVYARAVEIWFDGDEDVILEDNFFDITSDVPVRLRLTTTRPTAIESLRRELQIRSLYDVGRN